MESREEVLAAVNARIRSFEDWLVNHTPEGKAQDVDEFGDPEGEPRAVPLCRPEEAILRSFLLWERYVEQKNPEGESPDRRAQDGQEASR